MSASADTNRQRNLLTRGASLLMLLSLAGCAHPERQPQTQTQPVPAPVAPPPTTSTAPQPAPVSPPPPPVLRLATNWMTLFDGKSLAGWRVTDFAGAGEVKVENGQMTLEMGAALTGVDWTNAVPKWDYEISLEAMKLDGSDFFCGLTLPVGDSHFTFIPGGWGGGVVGISSIDNEDASMNETTKYMRFDPKQWYRFRVRVTRDFIVCWVDDEKIIELALEEKKISMRPGEIELSAPLGIAAWQTAAAIRDVKIRGVKPKSP